MAFLVQNCIIICDSDLFEGGRVIIHMSQTVHFSQMIGQC